MQNAYPSARAAPSNPTPAVKSGRRKAAAASVSSIPVDQCGAAFLEGL